MALLFYFTTSKGGRNLNKLTKKNPRKSTFKKSLKGTMSTIDLVKSPNEFKKSGFKFM